MSKLMKCLFAFLLMVGVTACDNGGNTSSSSSSSLEENEVYNKYEKEADEFHLKSWIGAPFEAFEITENDNETVVDYEKSATENYSYVYTTMKGDLADFSYVNITIKGSLKGDSIRTATLRIGVDTEHLEDNIIGADYGLALSNEYQTYSLKIKGVYRARLDIASALAVYPDIGKGGYDALGNLYADTMVIKDVWFSKTLPAGIDEVVNPNVDTGEDTATTVNGWSTYSWCGYSLVEDGENTIVGLNSGSIEEIEWSFIEYRFDNYKEMNKLKFVFENIDNSITKITMKLRGDAYTYVSSGDVVDGEVVEYGYYLYYEQTILQYDLSKAEHKPDSNGDVSFEFNIANEMAYFKAAPDEDHASKFEDGLSFVLLVESDPTTLTYNELQIPNPDGYGRMRIKEVVLSYDETFISYSSDGWLADEWTGYKIDGTKDGVKVSYNNPAEYGRIYKNMVYNNENELKLTINNVGLVCENIVIKIVGDEKGMNTSNPNNPYMEYYEYIIGVYSSSDYNSETEQTTITLPLDSAINDGFKNHINNGVQIWLLIESDPNYSSSFDKVGELYIISCNFN